MTATDVLTGLLLLVGLVGVVVPLLPGSALVAVGVLLWAALTGGTTAWVVAGTAVALLAVGAVVKYVVPGRGLSRAGVPGSTLWAGAVLGVVGFFVVPVVGLLIGFVLGVHLAERRRLGGAEARDSTVAAVRAVGLGLLIELVAALAAFAAWVVGVAIT